MPNLFQNSFYSPTLFLRDLRLPALNANPDAVTIAGYSGGSFAAAQFGVAMSDTFSGIGLFAGGPFGEEVFEGWTEIDPEERAEESLELAQQMESDSEIDSLSNLEGMPVYVASFENDKIVLPVHQEAQREFFESLGANVEWHEQPVTHDEPLFGCEDFDDDDTCFNGMHRNMLEWVTTNHQDDPLTDWEDANSDWESQGVFRAYWQADFDDSYLWQISSLSPRGYIFYPNSCVDEDAQCRLHIHLHGCGLSSRVFGHQTKMNMFNNHAAANNIIVLYPDIQYSWRNMMACFDTWGYSGDAYMTKDSVQGRYLQGLIDRVTAPIDEDAYNYEAGNYLEYGAFDWFWRHLIRFIPTLPYYLRLIVYQILEIILMIFGL